MNLEAKGEGEPARWGRLATSFVATDSRIHYPSVVRNPLFCLMTAQAALYGRLGAASRSLESKRGKPMATDSIALEITDPKDAVLDDCDGKFAVHERGGSVANAGRWNPHRNPLDGN